MNERFSQRLCRLLLAVLVLLPAAAYAADHDTWDAAHAAEARVVDAQSEAEASDPGTTQGDRLHRRALDAHEDYRSALQALLDATPPISDAEREAVLDGLLTSRELSAVLHIRLREPEPALRYLRALLGHPGIETRPRLRSLSAERLGEAEGLTVAETAGAWAARRSVAATPDLELDATPAGIEPLPRRDRSRGAASLTTAGAALALGTGAVLGTLSMSDEGAARRLVRSGEGDMDGYTSLSQRTQRRARAANVSFSIGGGLAVAAVALWVVRGRAEDSAATVDSDSAVRPRPAAGAGRASLVVGRAGLGVGW